MAFISTKSNIKNSILGFIRHLVSKIVYKDVELLLSPCCKPIFTFESMNCGFTPGDGGVYGTRFLNATILVPGLSNKTVIAILSSDLFGGSSYQNITLDSNGSWSGTLQTSWENSTSDFTATLSILTKDGSRVLRVSDPISVTGMPNCD